MLVLVRERDSALGAGEPLTHPYDPGAAMPAPRADAQTTPAALRIGTDLTVALVPQQDRLVGRRAPVRLLEEAALLAAPIPPERAIGEHRLTGSKLALAPAPWAARLATGFPLGLPGSLGIARYGLHGGKVTALKRQKSECQAVQRPGTHNT